MKLRHTQRGIATVTVLLAALAVLAAGGAVWYTYTPPEPPVPETREDEQQLLEEGGSDDITPAAEEDETNDTTRERQRIEEDEEKEIEEDITIDDDNDKDEIEAVTTPTTVELTAGESVRLDGTMTLTLMRAVLYERPSGGQADFRLSAAGGCGENAPPECLGPPGFQQEFSISETATEAVETGSYSFTLLQLGPNIATVRIERL